MHQPSKERCVVEITLLGFYWFWRRRLILLFVLVVVLLWWFSLLVDLLSGGNDFVVMTYQRFTLREMGVVSAMLVS